jgi:hypothetical protein
MILTIRKPLYASLKGWGGEGFGGRKVEGIIEKFFSVFVGND